MSTTLIEDISYEDNDDILIQYETDLEEILDMEQPSVHRIFLIELHSQQEIIEIINKLNSLFIVSKTTLLRSFIIDICIKSKINPIIKIECAKCICLRSTEDNMGESFGVLNEVISDTKEMIPVTCLILAIVFLSKCESFYENTLACFYEILLNDSYEDKFKYNMILSLENVNKLDKEMYIKKLLILFLKSLRDPKYIILSSQNLLQNFLKCNDEHVEPINKNLFQISVNEELEDDIRADAADILLSLGTEHYSKSAREVIINLGKKKFTMFDNKQNVHDVSIDDSTHKIIENILAKPLDKKINFNYVSKFLLDKCNECDECDECLLNVSLSRIYMDRGVYSHISLSLLTLLLRVFNYTCNHQFEDTLIIRLIEELISASGKCSSGYFLRLLNVLSGFDDMSLNISEEEEIKGKVYGRLNKLIKEIEDINIIDKILEEMTLESSDSNNLNRQNFLEFFRGNISNIKNDIWGDLRGEMDINHFELLFRKAISAYEGISIK